ncbi:hypothetical protein GGU10DRAFT_377905 [Lentinula aff. detonsa]|uniref:Uncharacterized protein n=1 Tax=Lentinula aff. detonsa TaxID=2804958 RepID=A0AA38NC95_9AGAR|nr:hypothetical protein GGU10DRAFT_377905 [Lentinula aff. detonsa]
MSTLLSGVNFVSRAHASAVDLQSLDDPSELYTIKGEIIFALVCVCLAGAVIGTLTVIGDIAVFAWNQLCRYALELRAKLQSKAEELKLREEQIRLREEQIRLRERELAQHSTLQIDADIQLTERLAQVFEYCAYTSRARAHELEIQRELFADSAMQDKSGGNRHHL